MLYKKKLTKEQALQKLRHYCRYQERSLNEVKEKLYDLGVSKKDQEEIISSLIEDNYQNEERFATAFASGKFRINYWGRIKIKYELKQKRINDQVIRIALQQIDEKNYSEVLKKLAKEKYASLKNEQYLIRKKKTLNYMIQKGYEVALINTAINSFAENNKPTK
jgi:regulatory protein